MENNQEFIIIALVSLSISVWLYFKFKNERKLKEKLSKDYTRLMADNALLEAEHLKFQLQPHTLNNILANLKAISNKLNRGMDSLSDTLEYILYKGNKHLVSVEDELDFIKRYLALNDLFISEIDSIKVNDSGVNKSSKQYKDLCIPHLITAYFIENAFKHGDVNHPQFLNIIIRLTDNEFYMSVTNRIKDNYMPKSNGGLGLKNMNKRLELLMDKKYKIDSSKSESNYTSTLTIYF
ncbi:MAG: histidine kinase [Bacteroidia bacterium]|nr:histidine kinase [Bacteroidia bacterium]